MKLRIMSMNIRYSRGKNGKNIWPNRKHLVGEVLQKYHPDIIGFQEPLLDQMQDLIEMLPNYQHIGVGREDGKKDGEFNPIFYKNLTIEQSGTFWLSDTPQVPSCTWGGQTRICTWAVVSAPVPFAFLNTHIEYEVLQAQINSMKLLINTAEKYADRMPVVLTGDFNYSPGSEPYQILSASMRDSYLEDPQNSEDTSVTFHNFSGLTTVDEHFHKGRIDYIWLTGNVNIERSRILCDRPGDDPELYPSDHWPILCDISLR